MPAAFVIYLASVYALSFLGPFAYPAGRDLAGGGLAELSGADRLALEAGRGVLLTAGGGIGVPLFPRGGAGAAPPTPARAGGENLARVGAVVWAPRHGPVLR